jgi:ABC-2 type transport system permease protein
MSKLIRDTRLIFGRSMIQTLRNPVWVFIGLFQPILYLLLFAPLLESLQGMPGFTSGSSLNTFTPGLLIMTALFSTAFVGFAVIDDLRTGVIERLRVTPVSRMALLLGMVSKDVVTLLVQSAVLVVVATLMGMRGDFLGVVLVFGLMILIGLTMASVSYAIALAMKDEGALASMLNTITVPLLLLSGITLPLALAPQLIRTLAKFNPFAYTVDAARALTAGTFSDASVLLGFIIMAVLAVLAVIWAARAFRQATA